MKRVATLQDLSCAGKCSLSVALPVLSSMEIEAVAIPTALYSNHTAFDSFVSYDLSDKIRSLSDGLVGNSISFDAIYTGYLGTKAQVDEILSFVDRFYRDGVIFIADPAMADDGVMYSGLSEDFAAYITRLISKADVIIPNITEACLLLGKEYKAPETIEENEIKKMLLSLSDLGPEKVIITGVHSGPDSIGAACFDKNTERYSFAFRKKQPGTYLGTGDIFASVVTGCLLRDQTPDKAMEHAVEFVALCIEATVQDPERRWYGVSFEKQLPMLNSLIAPAALH